MTGVWVGYDDFRPMPGITGGSLPAQAWHSYMSVAHKNYRAIPPIPGLGLHPNQVAEQQRLIELKRTDPGMAQAQMAQAAQKSSSLMPDQTRTCPEEAVETMRQAAGLQPTPASATPASASPPAACTARRSCAKVAAARAEGEAAGGRAGAACRSAGRRPQRQRP